MKGKKRHTLPLTNHVERILDGLKPSPSGLYFASRIGTPFCGFPYHFRKLTAEIGFSNFVLHDFRRVGATGMQRLRVGIETTEKLLAHRAVTGGLVGIYQRHAYLDEMREALLKWEAHLSALLD
jgi:integrase